MILDLDIGNSRVKWRLNRGGGVVETGALPLGCYTWQKLPFNRDGLQHIRAANVAGDEKRQALVQWAQQYCGITPEFAKTQATAAGVVCGYRQPEKLGVDRWLAIIAAFNRTKRPCLVIDAGSALTVDFVNAQGEHLGGYITPGLWLMQQQLFAHTSDVNVDAPSAVNTEPGKSTPEAVQHGCLRMALDFIQGCQARFNGPFPQLLLTGGDAPVLAPHLQGAELVPDLVLDGLALVLNSQKA